MAAVIGDYISDPARFHAMIANPQLQHHHHPHSHQHSHDTSSPYRPSSKPRRASTSRPSRSASASANAPQHLHVDADADAKIEEDPVTVQRRPVDSPRSSDPSSRIPSPPPSSSPAGGARPSSSDNGKTAPTTSEMITSTVAPSHVPTSSTTSSSSRRLQQPSPSSDDFQIPVSAGAPQPPRQTVIHVRDLAHVKVLAKSESLSGGDASMLNDSPLKYDISAMPINDIIEMVAALLTKITSTNDLQHDAMQRNATHQQQANTGSDASGSSISPMSHSVLAFHGKNVPAITIHSYLARIHKYCPTTFEVFLSLLVYFDRMTERVNDLVTKSEEARKMAAQSRPGSEQQQPRSDVPMKDTLAAEIPDESDSDLADDDDDEEMADTTNRKEGGRVITGPEEGPSVHGPSTYFVVDSFNIHRLIISGVTCSSKFFSDVFYTNSRYAKVGGLPLAELNHLELQFLVLNDFRLAIPVEDLEAYATMLVEFYAREVASKS